MLRLIFQTLWKNQKTTDATKITNTPNFMRGRDFLIITIGAILFSLLLARIFPVQNKNLTIISPLAEGFKQAKNILGLESSLAQVVEKSLAGTRGTYGIVIKNLRTGETYMLNEERIFEPASLYKLWVMGEVYNQVNEGSLSLDQTLSNSVEALNAIFDIASESAERKEGTVSLKVSQALERMITISDNYAAYLLSSKVKYANISAFMKDYELKGSTVGSPPKTTPYDIALLYEQIYSEKVIDVKSSKDMMDLLMRQQLNDRIPKYLPDSVKVAHKTGELGGFKHDAGIIYAKDPILFVALSESNAPLSAAERIALLSRDVFNYFEGK